LWGGLDVCALLTEFYKIATNLTLLLSKKCESQNRRDLFRHPASINNVIDLKTLNEFLWRFNTRKRIEEGHSEFEKRWAVLITKQDVVI